MSFRTTLLAVVALFSPACADFADRAPTAPDATFSMHTCELGVSATDAYALISELRAEVDALEAAGSLSSGQANALRNHLDNAVRHLNEGRLCPALAQLTAFRDQVASFEATGVLSEQEAAPLIEGIDQVTEGGPLAVADSYVVNEDQILQVDAPGVLVNDVDPQGSGLIVLLVQGPSHGILTIFANGAVTYVPHVDFSGTDQFTYRVSDGTAVSNVATVTITVRAVNDLPVAVDDSYSITAGNPLTVAAPGVLANDADVDGQTLTAILVSGVSNGVVTLNADGSFSYTPSADFSGTDHFTYKANDGVADSNTATVTVTVNPL